MSFARSNAQIFELIKNDSISQLSPLPECPTQIITSEQRAALQDSVHRNVYLKSVLDARKEKMGNPAGKWQIFHIRVNNPTEEELEHWKELAPTHCREMVIGNYEIGKYRGATHVHIHVHFLSQMTLTGVRRLFLGSLPNRRSTYDFYIAPSLHYFDKAFTPETNRDYCTKNGTLWSFGGLSQKRAKVCREEPTDDFDDLPSSLPEKEDDALMAQLRSMAKKRRIAYARKILDASEDASLIAMYERMHREHGHNYAHAFFPETYHTPAGCSVRKTFPTADEAIIYPPAEEQEVLWITGCAGTGKTSFLRLLHPYAYTKNKDTQYWEAFNFTDHSINNPHMAVVFNEVDTVQDLLNFAPNKSSFDAIKNIMDIFPFPIEIKHKQQEMIRPRRILITSNTTIEAIMEAGRTLSRHDAPNNKLYGLDFDTLSKALTRRIRVVHITELLDAYNCFVLPNQRGINFGGVFHNSVKNEIYKRLSDILSSEVNDLEVLIRVNELKAEMIHRSSELLKPMRWVPYNVIRLGKARLNRDEILRNVTLSLCGFRGRND